MNELGCWGVVGVGGSDNGVTGFGGCGAALPFFLFDRCCLELARIGKSAHNSGLTFFPASLPAFPFGLGL